MTTTNPSKRRAFLTGVGSILDLQGAATYRRMQSLMPPPAPRTSLNAVLVRASALSSSETTLFSSPQ
ncbi:hypothetical protein [Corynebacterium sp. HMSC08A12]|uniref:hypothetical protein n=1 Tax=Corynebacterium sp. HMSC08A12 TaxID=1581134 RepID=UPI000B1A3135|nr:hypothetical protein [Corynebacterium sp. HMSC08A12]